MDVLAEEDMDSSWSLEMAAELVLFDECRSLETTRIAQLVRVPVDTRRKVPKNKEGHCHIRKKRRVRGHVIVSEERGWT